MTTTPDSIAQPPPTPQNDRERRDSRARAIASFGDIIDTEQPVGDLVRAVTVRPEHDCWDRCAFGKPDCKPHTGGWHGIGSRQIIWSVSMRGVGAVSFNLYVPIYTETALVRGGASLAERVAEWSPLGALDLHYSVQPEYLDWLSPTPCCFIDGECWGDFTMMAADDGFAAYVAGGTPGVWSWLAETRLPDVLANAGQNGREADRG